MLRPSSDVVARQLGESAVLIRLTNNRIYELNPTGARFWALVGEGAPLASIFDTLSAEFDASPDVVRDEVEHLVRELLTERLLVEE